MSRFRLVRIEPEQNTWRFYAASVQPTLLGTFAVVREWGRVGSPGRVQTEEFASEEEAEAALARLRQVKEKRGYRGSIDVDAAEARTTG